MPLHIVRNDITQMKVDAIVNAANETLLGGGGVDGCIHHAAGPKLLEECRTLGGCRTGKAKITNAYNLPCRYVIHTVGPVYRGGKCGERELLSSCYATALKLALQNNCESVAFPLISTGIYGYPKNEALKIAIDEITDFLFENDMTVYIVIYDRKSFEISEKLFSDIREFIDDNYVDIQEVIMRNSGKTRPSLNFFPETCKTIALDIMPPCQSIDACEDGAADNTLSLEDALKYIDESFSQMLLRLIDEKGMKDSECYKKANVDRKLFSKIRSNIHYRPAKSTVIAFAIALELSLDETKDMLMKAGFALSRSNKFDLIIEYFVSRGIYDIFEINNALFAFDQNLLGA
ncbi:MAG: O-acetyl-ADP-ribose deacetylase [Ruminococcaceae bacterium]|nr:O-acetyl-ADP-ribose deacetylase [Oscillospiraceae bacterium]